MISTSLIKKWKNMLLRKSVFHVNQTEGLYYSRDQLKGYYNNLTDKITFTTSLDKDGIPFNTASYGEKKKKVYFPIAIFQYGLGAYDLFLKTGDQVYLDKALSMADWAIANQEESGAWNTFGILQYSNPYSSMAQGEGASLLVRLYKETGDERYLKAAESAATFMLKPLEQGGTAVYITEDSDTDQTDTNNNNNNMHLMLLEYPEGKCVLNGWIFSAFGLYDLWLVTGEELYRNYWKAAVRGIKKYLQLFDTGHWTYYDLGKKYASPFYHSLHIELLKALQNLNQDRQFNYWITKWTHCRNHWFWRRFAFAIKAMQKLTEQQKKEWVLTG